MNIKEIVDLYEDIKLEKDSDSAFDRYSGQLSAMKKYFGDASNKSKDIILASSTEGDIARLRTMILKEVLSSMIADGNLSALFLIQDEDSIVTLVDTFMFQMLGVLIDNEIL